MSHQQRVNLIQENRGDRRNLPTFPPIGWPVRTGERVCRRSNQLQLIRRYFHRRRLVDEIQPQQHRAHPMPLFHPTLHSLQRPAPNFHPRALTDAWRQAHFQFRIQGREDFLQLPREGFLIKNIQQIGDVVVLADADKGFLLELEKDVAGEQRLAEHHGLAAILVRRVVARQRDGEAVSRAILDQFFFPARPGVGHRPK